ncbi:MAG TPA: anti-sigma factor [Acidobacteriaceae bacterium]|jgi:hypothetical protein|nr:anti-sigma factor [Acidobacteriaceae bacterium]
MQFEHNNHDDAINKTLSALKSAAPPEGMEARILQRLQQSASAAPFLWRDLLTGSALAGAWWRGALTGLAAAMLLVGILLLAQHGLRPTSRHDVSQVAATRNLVPTPVSVAASPGCPAHAQVHRAWVGSTTGETIHARVHHAWIGPSTSFAPSHPAPVLPLTAQERALVRLVQTVNPKQLASFNFDAQEKAETQEIDDFNKFFTPPPAPPQPADNDSPTNTQQPAPQQGEQI